ncbi:MAG: hypothetical protein WC503_03250 [Candidatus Shapirobacteria bacterium]
MKTNNLKLISKSGQALTSLLIIMFVGLIIITTSSALINTSLSSTALLLEANDALVVAESGAEDALLKILRNPSYVGGTLPFDIGLATISVSSTNPYTFVSKGTVGQHQRSIQVIINNNNGIMTVSSWKEQ